MASIHRVVAAYFSPTGNTQKVVMTIASFMANTLNSPLDIVDFTVASKREMDIICDAHKLLVVGLPTYAGRLPNKILPFVQTHIKGCNSIAIPIVTFGNRSMDESLKELCLELDTNGFIIPAAAGIVTEHVFSEHLGSGRPNSQDISDLEHFALHCCEKLESNDWAAVTFYKESPLGDYYKPLKADGTPARFLKAKPKTHTDLCINCGLCASNCPMGAIDAVDTTVITGTCIKCHSCIKCCPSHAKYFDDDDFLSHVTMLEANYKRVTHSTFCI